MDLSLDYIVAVINNNWAKIVEFFDKLWAWAKETILKDDSPFADLDE